MSESLSKAQKQTQKSHLNGAGDTPFSGLYNNQCNCTMIFRIEKNSKPWSILPIYYNNVTKMYNEI